MSVWFLHSPPFPSQLKQLSFAPWALILPLRPPFIQAVLSILTTRLPCVAGVVRTCMAVPGLWPSKVPDPQPGIATATPLLPVVCGGGQRLSQLPVRLWGAAPRTPALAGCKPRQCTPTCFSWARGKAWPIHTVPPMANCSNLSYAVISENTLHDGKEQSVTKNNQVFSHKADKTHSCFRRLHCLLL